MTSTSLACFSAVAIAWLACIFLNFSNWWINNVSDEPKIELKPITEYHIDYQLRKKSTLQLQNNEHLSSSASIVKYLLANTSTLTSISNLPRFQVGDVVDDFKLVQKLETLGLNKIYHSDVSWDISNLYLAPNLSAVYQSNNDSRQNIIDNSLVKSSNQHRSKCFENQSFCLDENIFHGGHGEIWRAHKVNRVGIVNLDSTYILKRMHVRDRNDILHCAKREIYFGNLLADRSSFARFITYFTTEDDYWLVFHDEGISLQALMYAITYNDENAMLKPSLLWKKLRTTKSGETSMKGIMYQLISSLEELHKEGIVHRDVKPSNVLLNTDLVPKLLVADFSSGWQSSQYFEAQLLYSSRGPSTDEESLTYAPPEVLLALSEEGGDASIPFDARRPESFDIWSVGVLFLELILGTADIFTIDHRTAAILANKLRSKPKLLPKAILLASLAEFCIYRRPDEVTLVPSSDVGGYSSPGGVIVSVDDSRKGMQFAPHFQVLTSGALGSLSNLRTCGLEELSKAILKRDPLAIGLRDKWALDLLSRLLRFDPLQRINLSDALNHAYFHGAYICERDGLEFATSEDLAQHSQLHPCEPEHAVNICSLNSTDQCVGIDLNSVDQNEPVKVASLPISMPAVEEHYHNAVGNGTDHVHSSVEDFSDMPVSLQHDDFTTDIAFRCPKCGRTFPGNWAACQHHLKLRNHGSRCLYPADALPPCLSEHSLLPLDPQSGWCDLQGRRKYIEDVHAMYFSEHFKFYGVFDGHFGSQAAKFSATHLFGLFEHLINNHCKSEESFHTNNTQSFVAKQNGLLEELNKDVDWRTSVRPAEDSEVLLDIMRQNSNFLNDQGELVSEAISDMKSERSLDASSDRVISLTAHQLSNYLSEAFSLTNRQLFLKANQSVAGPSSITSGIGGTTATVVIEFKHYLMIAHVGDSRVVACCSRQLKHLNGSHSSEDKEKGSRYGPVQLTLDHTPHSPSEAESVRIRGGWIDSNGSVPRVNGHLAVTRSLGDSFLGDVLSSLPDVLVLDILSQNDSDNDDYLVSSCDVLYANSLSIRNGSESALLFLIIASDGLWDVLSSAEAIELVCDSLLANDTERPSSLTEATVATSADEKSGRDSGDRNSIAGVLPAYAFHEASKLLAQEAYLRGSSDNIGVCVVDLRAHS